MDMFNCVQGNKSVLTIIIGLCEGNGRGAPSFNVFRCTFVYKGLFPNMIHLLYYLGLDESSTTVYGPTRLVHSPFKGKSFSQVMIISMIEIVMILVYHL